MSEEVEAEAPVSVDSLNSLLVKPHNGLAAAIARVLSGEQENNIVAEGKSDGIGKLVKRKHAQVRPDRDEEEEGSDEEQPQAVHCQSEIVKLCHRAVLDYPADEEKKLQRLATRGVVQLFNAVSKHQKSIEDKLKEVGSSERKKHKILSSVDKGGFIDLLKQSGDAGGTGSSTTQPTWSILRDDYMKNSKLQNWDQDDDNPSRAGSSESDSGSD